MGKNVLGYILGDYFVGKMGWAIFWTIILWGKMVGLYFGQLFHNLIWSP
jgi:hypothetical protein